ncbi:hypothetical protein ADL15_22275 [Actinoplanes awajinensis subsp. mycoplanecinus]|uniref:Uncharacterized protein n=1 Tax=Actinoplanes awajinensis subsp. mycoplanecinus TaxID=135947 RepID=A0A117MR89_9ACTN|nr:hypothetical protein ADL15_22275 [Actinoplanes awajinensis subsp. mycoplanecinus]
MAILQPLHEAVRGRFPEALLEVQMDTDGGLRLLTRRLRTETHSVAVVVLSMMAEPSIHGPNFFDDQWESAMALLESEDDPDPAPYETTIEPTSETRTTEALGSGTRLEELRQSPGTVETLILRFLDLGRWISGGVAASISRSSGRAFGADPGLVNHRW